MFCFKWSNNVSLTCSQPWMMQQQRWPQGLGFTMVVIFSLACRSRKNFLLRSVFFLHAKEQLCHTEVQDLAPSNQKDTTVDTHSQTHTNTHFTSQTWDTSIWPRCNKCGLPVQHSFHKLVWESKKKKKERKTVKICFGVTTHKNA